MYTTFNAAFERMTYPAGESHVQARDLHALARVTTVEATVRNFTDLADLVTADRILRHNHITVDWFVPYFPFARHDRRNDSADGFELEVALHIVDELVGRLTIADPHSDVSGMLTHITQSSTVEVMRELGAFDSRPLVVVPDAGAIRKSHEWMGDMLSVQALKYRDPQTGRLSAFRVLAEGLQETPCVIVDDICDGGGTFLGLANELHDVHGAAELTLVITHGLFTKGLSDLQQSFARIFSFGPTDEVPEATTTNGVTQVPYRVLYEKGTRR